MSRKVLIVEDNLDMAQSTAHLLTDEGYKVEYVINASAACLSIPKFKPDAIILDLGLPDIHGILLLKRVREVIAFARVYVVCVSGTSIDRDEVLDAGADEFLRKPIEFAHLAALLRGNLPDQP